MQPEEGLGLRLAHLIKRVVQLQNREQAQLLARGLEASRQERVQQSVESGERLAGLFGIYAELGEPPAAVIHLLQEIGKGESARGRSRGNGAQSA